MRNLILTMAMVLTTTVPPAMGPLHAAEKAPKPDVGPGRVAWFDIATPNLTQSKEFYGKLLDWHFTGVQGTDLAVEIVAGGKPIGTLRKAEGKISPFNGVVYVQVTNLPDACKRAKELGATIPPGFPFNLGDAAGAIALVVDPAGNPIGLYSRTPLPPSPTPAK